MAKRASSFLAAVLLICGVLATVGVTPAAALTAANGATCTIVGTAGNDVLNGTAGSDVICGLGGNDVINGNAGNDTLDGGTGNDTLNGGFGNDTLIGGTGADTENGGTGSDTASYVDHATPVTANLDGAANDGSASEHDKIATDIENLTGGTGADTLTGSSGANVLTGGAGNDMLNGSAGNDTISGGTGNDTLNGSTGNDTISGGAGADTMNGGAGADVVSYADHTTAVTANLDGAANDGSAGEHDKIAADVEDLTGGTAVDTLTGNNADNVLNGGGGNDTLNGGAGVDALIGGTGHNSLNGGAGDDGFSGNPTDAVDSGTGDASCPLTVVLGGCTQGAVITSISQTSSLTGPFGDPGTAADITVNAHVVDFSGVGLTKVAVIPDASVLPGDPNYYTSVPALVGGTAVDGDWRATFHIVDPPAEDLGMRLFTSTYKTPGGFSIQGGPGSDPYGHTDGLLPAGPQSLKCVSTFPAVDAECGVTSFSNVALGFPKPVPAIHLTSLAGVENPTIDGVSFASSTSTGVQSIAVHVRAHAAPGTKIAVIGIGFRPPASSGLQAPPKVFVPFAAAGPFAIPGQVSETSIDDTYTVDVPFNAPGQWRLMVDLFPEVDGYSGPLDYRAYESEDLAALGQPGVIDVAPGPTALTVTKTGRGSATVTSSPAGIDCGATCSESALWGTHVTLTATPDPGTTFRGWSGACGGAGTTCSVTLDADKSVTANFLGPLSDAAGVGAGGAHTCAALADTTVACWGWNQFGQLGRVTPPGSPTNKAVAVTGLSGAVTVAVGENHTCALMNDSTVRCWGSNSHGQLGDLSELTGVTAVAAGGDHTCALLIDQTVECWGANESGELGDGTINDSTLPVAVSNLTNVTAISSGYDHSCALLIDTTVECWGYDLAGQLGDGNNTNSPVPVAVSGLTGVTAIAAGAGHTCALLADTTVDCWGYNAVGELGNGTNNDSNVPGAVSGLTGVTAISSGYGHSCALLADTSVECWGLNNAGQLGDGTNVNRSAPVAVPDLTGATAISAGHQHSCAVVSDTSLQCWGSNNAGQLGDGASPPISSSPAPVTVVG